MADTITSTDLPQVHGQVVLNPDGTAIGTPVGGATSANQTNGTQKTQIVDVGGEAVTVTGGKLDVNATVSTTGLATDTLQTTGNAILTTIDGDTGAVAAGYAAEGAALGSGVLLQADDGTDRINVLADTSGHLQVDVLTLPAGGAGLTDSELRATPVPVSGTVTSNAGTNLNTSALALEAGGNLAAIKAKTDNIPALGQALAAASTPVVLTAAQITTLTPPAAIAGFATSAKQDTIIGHVDGVETLLGTIDADTGNIATEVAGLLTDTELRATPVPVSGTVTANLAAGTNNIGDVDVLTMPTVTVTATDLDIRNLANTDVVTAELSAVDNAVLDTIAAKDFATQTTLAAMNAKMVTGTDIGDVTINNSTGAAAVNIQDGGNTITVDGTVAVTNADLTTLAGAVSATHMQADIVGALPAGSAIIGKTGIDQTTPGTTNLVALSAETTKVIGTVRVASGGIASGAIASGAIASGAIASGAIASGAIAAGAIAAGNTSIATTEDTARAAGEHLVKVGLSRLDVPVANANVGSDNEYTNFTADNFGKLWVAGTVPEDTAHIAGEAITVTGARRIDTPATSAGASGDWATIDASAEGALWTTNTPTTTGGCTIFRSIDLDETEEDVKATAGNLYGYFAFNAAASTQYIKFYNATAANVSVGSTTPVLTFPIPAGSAAHISFAFPIGFSTAICAAATTGIADADTGAPAANSVILNAFYK